MSLAIQTNHGVSYPLVGQNRIPQESLLPTRDREPSEDSADDQTPITSVDKRQSPGSQVSSK